MSAKCNPVGWFEIYVQDMDRAKAFYEKTFDVTLERLESPEVELWTFPMQPDAPGCAGALVGMSGKDSGAGGTLVYFPGPDCAAMAERAIQNGGRIQNGKKSIGEHGFIAHVLDTEGNLIGLHSMQ
ncbi:MAG: VOC family protein [Terrimicrobiaceae bacterium]|nr:VOC family protein [Terrimicrobiaceae bacterium]